MASSNLIIAGEIFLVFVCGAAYLFYQFNQLNDQLLHKNDQLHQNIKDEKRNAKGLKVKIQDQIAEIKELKQSIKQLEEGALPEKEALKEKTKEYDSLALKQNKLNKQIELLEQKLATASTTHKAAKEKIQTLTCEIEQLSAGSPESDKQTDYEELYHDLKNSIAYNMTGGDQVLDVLKQRLIENGNLDEGEKLEQLKDRYNSLGGMVGLVIQKESYDEEQLKKEQRELKKIEEAEELVNSANNILKEAELLSESRNDENDRSNKQVDQLEEELEQLVAMNTKLREELDLTAGQLKAFIEKARLFQLQKEQIKMHKATQTQMHRNFVNLSAEYKQLSRQYKTMASKNEMLSSQITESNADPILLKKLDDLSAQLKEKEKVMDRLEVEKEMVEQQFLSISEESESDSDSTEALVRLESEHKLLEQQFLEVLTELKGKKS